ncbi:Fanconi anemia group G protein isoform 2-T2 [Pholidichthys leucotaenia]
MNPQPSLFNSWVLENNKLVNKCKDKEGGQGVFSQDLNQVHLRWCSSEFHKLMKKIQGVPPHLDHTPLELAVVYNACVCSVARCQFEEAQLLLTQAAERANQITGDDPGTPEPLLIRTFLRSVRTTALSPCGVYLLCLQWAIWLATSQLKTVQEFQREISSHFEEVGGGVGDQARARGKISNVPLFIMEPKRLMELLHISTSLSQGVERMNEGQTSEALSVLRVAATLPGPRDLVAYTHLLSGSSLSKMGCPHMALQCFRKALETDSGCVSALYQSVLIYRQLGNAQAEIQALRILHSTLMLPLATEPSMAGIHPLSSSLLLSSQSLSSLLSVPTALSVLHSLALKCVLHGRISEGVEHYLDLLAVLQSNEPHGINMHAEGTTFPRIPELYLEAATALLIAQRPADCMPFCKEVISITQELLPEKVVIEEPEEGSGTETRDVCVKGHDKLWMILWASSAHLLLGHCHTQENNWNQAVTHYTRCVNLLVKVHFKKTGFPTQIEGADVHIKYGTEQCILQRLKGLSLAGRGISFTQMDRLKEGLRDLELSLQALPEASSAGLWCGDVLWRLGRKQEAAACWEKTWSLTSQPSVDNLPVYLQELHSGPLLDSSELRSRIQKLGPT